MSKKEEHINILIDIFEELGYSSIRDIFEEGGGDDAITFQLKEIKKRLLEFKLGIFEEKEEEENQTKPEIKIKIRDFIFPIRAIKNIREGGEDKRGFYFIINEDLHSINSYSNQRFYYPSEEDKLYELNLLKMKLEMLNIKIL